LIAGGLGVAFLLLLPRFYFHSHAATLDIPVAAMYLAAAATVLFAERSTKAALLAGPVFGLASATKLNGPFVLLGCALIAFLLRRRRAGPISIPSSLFSMVVLGPPVFFALWPWMWFDTAARVQAYVQFHLNHYGIYFLYFGTVFSKDPNAPWHAPFTMAATTTPLATSALALAGIALAFPLLKARLRFTEGPDDDLRKEGDLVLTLVVHAFLSVAIVAFSGGPKYGGEKLFAPFFPFWCLLAGYGALRLYERAHRRSWAFAAIGVALSSALALQLRFGEYALSEYNGLAGGLRGATATGFERQYYDIAHRDLVRWMNENAPENARIHFLPNNWEYIRTYNWYKRGGDLRGDIQVVQTESAADLIVLTHERRFARYGDDLRRWRDHPVLKEKIVDGTPIWSVVQAR
jgi:4-amino-4-deoxy-L-arabinose transferase-like glycosyltransferase